MRAGAGLLRELSLRSGCGTDATPPRGVQAALGLQAPGPEQVPTSEEHRSGHHHRGDEGQSKDEANVPQTQAASLPAAYLI